MPSLDDQFWPLLEPLLPRPPRRYRHPGRRRVDDRRAFCGILFVLTTGIAWQRLPADLGYGSGMTCWRRLHEWQQAGVFDRMHQLLLAKLRQADRLDLSRAVACDDDLHRDRERQVDGDSKVASGPQARQPTTETEPTPSPSPTPARRR
jgi:transposase